MRRTIIDMKPHNFDGHNISKNKVDYHYPILPFPSKRYYSRHDCNTNFLLSLSEKWN